MADKKKNDEITEETPETVEETRWVPVSMAVTLPGPRLVT